MMTTTDRLDALAMITRSIHRDATMTDDFTLTRSQLRIRIDNYLDHPDATSDDIDAIFAAALILDELPLRD